jgi:hypothetical protein
MLRTTVMVLATVAAISGGLLALTRLLAPPHTVVGMDSVMGVRTLSSRYPHAISILRISSAANADTTRGGTGAPITAP